MHFINYDSIMPKSTLPPKKPQINIVSIIRLIRKITSPQWVTSTHSKMSNNEEEMLFLEIQIYFWA